MSNSSNINDHTDVCANESGTIPNRGKRTFQCTNVPKMARYVSVINGKGKDHSAFALCEVVVIGTEAQGTSSLLFSFIFKINASMIYFVTIVNLQTVIYVDLVTVIPSMAVILVLMEKGNQIANKVMKISKLKLLKSSD